MKKKGQKGFGGGVMQSAGESLMGVFGFKPSDLTRGARKFLGVIVVEHIVQIMHDDWLAWEVKRVLNRKFKIFKGDFSIENPFPNFSWGPSRDAIYQVITHPDLQ